MPWFDLLEVLGKLVCGAGKKMPGGRSWTINLSQPLKPLCFLAFTIVNAIVKEMFEPHRFLQSQGRTIDLTFSIDSVLITAILASSLRRSQI